MYWSRLFIPTLREDPAESQNAAHRLLIRAGYMRGASYLFLGRRVLRKMAGLVCEEMDAIGGQEMLAPPGMGAIASELRSYRQLPQFWYQFDGFNVRSTGFDLTGETGARIGGAWSAILARSEVKETANPPEGDFHDPQGDFSPEEFETPGQKTIADLTSFTGLPATSQMKSVVMVADGKAVLALVRGDDQVHVEKLKWYLGAAQLRPADGEEIRAWFGADAGSLGPVGLKNVRVVADAVLRGRRNMVCGANRNDRHLRNVTPGKDFDAEFQDIRHAANDARSIQRVRQVRSTLQVSNPDAELVNMTESVCEVLMDRWLYAAVDQHRDVEGLAWPAAIAPFAAVITPVNFADEAQRRAAIELHDAAPFDVLLDDRDERPGVKFKDADLVGIPFRITLGKKLTQGMVEIKDRRAGVSQDAPVSEALSIVSGKIK